MAPISADLHDNAGMVAALGEIEPNAVFIAIWARHDSEAENVRVNVAMVRNLMNGLPRPRATLHLAQREGLVEPDLARHGTPTDLGRSIKVVTDMSKERRLGLAAYRSTDNAFLALSARLPDNRSIPS